MAAVIHQSALDCINEDRAFTAGSGSMKRWKAVLLACFAAGALVAEHGQLASINSAADSSGTVAAQTSLVHILNPVPDQRLSTNYVDVNYELVNPGAAGGDPNFQVQLDARDPVTTDVMSQTFTGLNPGQHRVIVQMVDANGTPIPGGRAEVVFYVVGGASQPQGAQTPGSTANNDVPELAPASSALPLLSVIGFGVLLGGVATAMRTRG
jgi:hypothetical protein